MVALAAMDETGLTPLLAQAWQPATFRVEAGGQVLEQGLALRAFPELEAVLY